MNNSYYYRNKNELINKSIKINYLESYENLTNKTYNSEISKIIIILNILILQIIFIIIIYQIMYLF